MVIRALQEQRDRQALERRVAGDRWEGTGLEFTTRTGRPLDARNVTRGFKAKLKAVELLDIRWHDLRRSGASILLAKDVPLPTI